MVRHGRGTGIDLGKCIGENWMIILSLIGYSIWNVILILTVQGAIGGMELIEIKSLEEMGLPTTTSDGLQGSCIVKGGLEHDQLMTPAPYVRKRRTPAPASPSLASGLSSSELMSSFSFISSGRSGAGSGTLTQIASASSSSATSDATPVPLPPAGSYDTVMQYRLSLIVELFPGPWANNLKNRTVPAFSVVDRYAVPGDEKYSNTKSCPDWLSQCYDGDGNSQVFSNLLFWETTSDHWAKGKTANFDWQKDSKTGEYKNPITTQIRGLIIALNLFRFTNFPLLCLLCIAGLISGYVGVIIFTLILAKVLERCMSKEAAEKGAWGFVVGFFVFNLSVGHFCEQWGSMIAILALGDQFYDQPACTLSAPGPLARDVKWETFAKPGSLRTFLLVVCIVYGLGGSLLLGIAFIIRRRKKNQAAAGGSPNHPGGKLGTVTTTSSTTTKPPKNSAASTAVPKPNNTAFLEQGIPEEELLAMGGRDKPQPEVPDEELLAYQPPTAATVKKTSAPIPDDEELLAYGGEGGGGGQGKSSAPLPSFSNDFTSSSASPAVLLGAPPAYSDNSNSTAWGATLPPPSYSSHLHSGGGREEDFSGTVLSSSAPPPTLGNDAADFGSALPQDSDVFLLDKREKPLGVMTKPRTYRDRLEAMMKHYCPAKAEPIMMDKMLSKYIGKEDQMFTALVSKYGPEPPAPSNPSAADDFL